MDRELNIIVSVVTAAAKRSLETAERSFKSLKGTVATVTAALGRFGRGLVGMGKRIVGLITSVKSMVAALAALAIVQKITGYFAELSQSIDRFAKLSQETGVAIETLSGIAQTIGFAGASAENFEMGLRRLNSMLGQASSGMGEGEKIFKDAGITIRNTNGEIKSTEEVLFLAAERIKGAGSAADQAAVAARIFGEEAGPKMVNALRGGEAGLRKFIEQAQFLGVVFSAEQAARVEAMNDAFARLGLAIRGIFGNIFVTIAGDIQNLVDATTSLITTFRDDIVRIASDAFQRFSGFVERAGNLIGRLFTGEGREQLADALEKTILQIQARWLEFFGFIGNAATLTAIAISEAIKFSVLNALSEVTLTVSKSVEKLTGSLNHPALQELSSTFNMLTGQGTTGALEGLEKVSQIIESISVDFSTIGGNSQAVKSAFQDAGKAFSEVGSSLSGPEGLFSALLLLSEGGPFSEAIKNLREQFRGLDEDLKEGPNKRTKLLGQEILTVGEIAGQVGEGVKGGLISIIQSIQDVSGSVSGSITGAFSSMTSAATGFFESIISGEASASDAFKAFIQAMISALISLAAQLIVTIGLALLLNALGFGIGAIAGSAATAGSTAANAAGNATAVGAPVGDFGGGLIGGGGFFGASSFSGAAPPAIKPSSVNGGGQTNITNNINALDAKSFAEMLGSPTGRRGIGAANQSNASSRLGGF
jgi:hypothetical protein